MVAQVPPDKAPVTDAAAPFDDPKADVILRSSDNVDFRCYKVLLSLASTFFDGMFSLPQPNGPGMVGDAMKDGLHVVPVEEPAAALEPTLRLCHPASIRTPPALALADIRGVFSAARKYGMEDAEHIARAALVSPPFLASDPWHVFGVACSLKLAAEARLAAAATLAFDVEELSYVPELESISGADIFHFRRYRTLCREAAREVANDAVDLRADAQPQYTWFECTVSVDECPNATAAGGGQQGVEWWIDGYLVPCQTRLESRPTGKTVKAEELLFAALKGAQICPHCRSTRFDEMRAFAERFGEEIDQAVAKVILILRVGEI